MNRSASGSRFEKQFLDLDTIRLHFARVSGGGSPLVMLHGIGMDWRVWQAVSRHLQPFFDLYLPDMRGHGQTEKPPHGYSLSHYAADIEDFIDQLGLSQVILVGSSLGGMVTAAVESPSDVISRRILVDPPLTGGPVRDAEMFRAILHLKHLPPNDLAEYLRRFNPGTSPYLLKTMSEMWHEASDGVIEDMLAQSDDYNNVDSALKLITAPTMLMQADPSLGAALTDDEAKRALDLLPDGSLLKFPGAGHAIHAFRPQEFADAVVAFSNP